MQVCPNIFTEIFTIIGVMSRKTGDGNEEVTEYKDEEDLEFLRLIAEYYFLVPNEYFFGKYMFSFCI